MSELVENEPIREAFRSSGKSLSWLAREMGFPTRTKRKPRRHPGTVYVYEGHGTDTKVLGRALGLHKERGTYYSRMNYDMALRVVELIGCDPVDVGL